MQSFLKTGLHVLIEFDLHSCQYIHTHTLIQQYNLTTLHFKMSHFLLSAPSVTILYSPGIFQQSTDWSPCSNTSSKPTARVIFLKHRSCSSSQSPLLSNPISHPHTPPPILQDHTSSEACKGQTDKDRFTGAIGTRKAQTLTLIKGSHSSAPVFRQTRNQCFDKKCLNFFLDLFI